MSTELILLKELAHVTASQSEWLNIASVVNQQIRNEEFSALFNRMVDEFLHGYRFVVETLQPFIELVDADEFATQFATLSSVYQKNYLLQASRPRHHADRAFELYLQLQQRRELKTGYPLLKRTFERLDYMVDKYVTNDAWLVMSVETIMKRLSRFLNEIGDLIRSDADDALLAYRGLMAPTQRYLTLLVQADGAQWRPGA